MHYAATLLMILMAVLAVGGIFLQIFLSRRESRWPGLILPGVCLLYSLLAVLGLWSFAGMSNREVVSQMLATFLTTNIPTVILLGIYFGCREKGRRKAQLEKMNIQDLD